MGRHIFIVFVAGIVMAATAGAAAPGSQAWRAKVDSSVLDRAAAGQTEFLVYFAQQADLRGAYALKTKAQKGRYVFERLQAVARQAQGPTRSVLERLGVHYHPFWIVNAISARGDLRAVQTVALLPEVAHVYTNFRGRAARPVATRRDADSAGRSRGPQAVEASLMKVRAHDVWALGYTGQGAVVASADTGVQLAHPALLEKYRGWNGPPPAQSNHDYNWHDAIGSGGGTCPAPSSFPCDDHNHGSHTTGTMVGDDELGNQIGMAPGAKWIACRNMDQGNGTVTTYLKCMQWLHAPTKADGTGADPTKAPDVVNNSWSCTPTEEGCRPTDPPPGPEPLRAQLAASRAAGIFYVSSAGNSGAAGCNTVNNPLGMYAHAFSVGATNVDATDSIASFSSRGPSTDGGHPKPDISAPGVSIRSSTRTGYGVLSGTSMAAPHVAGLVALIISAKPALAGNVPAIESIIKNTAVPRTAAACGSGASAVPNNTYGWGRIDAFAAVQVVVRGPTGVAVRSLAVTVTRRGVTVRWRTAPAQAARALGFHVWRGPAAAGRYTRLTKALIPARPTAAYQYLDRTARRARTYFYKLQLVGADGLKTWFGPLRARRR